MSGCRINAWISGSRNKDFFTCELRKNLPYDDMSKSTSLFCDLNSRKVAQHIRQAERRVLYVAPGIQPEVAKALVLPGDLAEDLDRKMLALLIQMRCSCR